MQGDLERLLAEATDPIGAEYHPDSALRNWAGVGTELAALLTRRNGFYAFHDALLVRPWQSAKAPCGIQEWNGLRWKTEFDCDLSDAYFFAEDIFGNQFGLRSGGICIFDPESGDVTHLCDSLATWARTILDDAAYWTGFPLAEAWQTANERLQRGCRLLPKLPFMLGGKYETSNLYALNDAEGMSFRASLSNQLRNVPDGTPVIIRLRGNDSPG